MHSNRHAPSLDIALQFAQYNRIRHILSRGPVQLNIYLEGDHADDAKIWRAALLAADDTLINAGKAGLWQACGRGLQTLLNKKGIIASYLGMWSNDDVKPFMKGASVCFSEANMNS